MCLAYNIYIMGVRVYHEHIFQTMFLSYPESLQYTCNKCVYIQATFGPGGMQTAVK